jgi:hypothetical protein
MNEKPFEHQAHHGTWLRANRCDFQHGVAIIRPPAISDEHFASDMMEIAAWHALQIHPHLNGFQGYDAVRIELRTGVEIESADPDIKQWQCHAPLGRGQCGRWNMGVSTRCAACNTERPK